MSKSWAPARWFLALLVLAGGPGPADAAPTPPGAALEAFDPRKEPAPADWRFFLKAPERERELLWGSYVARGRRLKDWAWGWRLGWVRACGQNTKSYCRDVLVEALFDRALVVRAEAASTLGRRFEGTADAGVLGLLAKAYGHAKNRRGGKPLFVQQRILFALRQVGGEQARELGQQLAASHPESREYWEKIVAAQPLP